MRLLAVIALAAGALSLGTVGASTGAAATSHRLLGMIPHAPRAHAFAPRAAKPAKKAAGFNCVSACTAYETTIDKYFTDVAAASASTTNVYGVLSQYYQVAGATQQNIAYNVTFGGSYVDGAGYPTTNTCHDGFDTYCVTDNQIQAHLAKLIKRNHWPLNTSTAIYFVFLPANVGVCGTAGAASKDNPCTTNYFCAYHSAGNGFIYAVEPDDAAVSQGACDTGEAPAGNGADSTLSTISHEQIEAFTDPYGNGWWSEDGESYFGIPNAFYGSEIGDLCAWNFGSTLGTEGTQYNQVINGDNYFLQQEYSNADNGCVQQPGGTATNFAPGDPLYAGTGPLVYQGGSVMLTNTAYALYWVPAAPANKTLPSIAGTAKVGKTLTALHGSWTNTPTKYTYQWLRCSSSDASSCKPIAKETKETYTLVPADAHRHLRVAVTATNTAGSLKVLSDPTGKVRS